MTNLPHISHLETENRQLKIEERQEALYFLQGESPCWVRSSQPPIPSVALKWVTIEEGADPNT